MFRVCCRCKVELPIELFYVDKGCRLGRSYSCSTCVKAAKVKYRSENKEKCKKNQEKCKLKKLSEGKDIYSSIRRYRKKYPDRHNSREAKRNADKIKATPSWVTKEELEAIKSMYTLAKKLSKIFKVDYHVDHIIPLRGGTVCGLHTIKNLQILEASLNRVKSNKFAYK